MFGAKESKRIESTHPDNPVDMAGHLVVGFDYGKVKQGTTIFTYRGLVPLDEQSGGNRLRGRK